MDQDKTLPTPPPLPEIEPEPGRPDLPGGPITPARRPAGPPRRIRRRVRARSRRRRFIKYALFIVAGLLLACILWVGWKFVVNTTKATRGNIFGLLSTTKLDGESTGRVNILLAGNSADDPGHGGSDLTDSIMVVSLDVKNHTASMISIPRDLWVSIPGYGHAKINTAYTDGGMDLLARVVSKDLGIPINYYALTDYTAFKQAVDTVGGIDVNIHSADSRGIYDPNISKADHGPLRLKNGLQHLDGQTALNLARARNDPTPDGRIGYGLPGGDFDRSANQRLMLTALESKIFSSGTFANPVKIGQLLDSLGDNVHTSFHTNELSRLYKLGSEVKAGDMKSLSLSSSDTHLIKDYAASDGQAALIPTAGLDDFGAIQSYIRAQFSSDPVIHEDAQIVVLNGSGTSGLAKTTAKALGDKGLNVTDYATANTPTSTTQLIDNSEGQKPATLKLLNSTYHPGAATNALLTRQYPDADFILILGSDQSTR